MRNLVSGFLVGSLVLALVSAVVMSWESEAWSDSSGSGASSAQGAAPAAASSPVASAAPTPVAPLVLLTMVGPLSMASPNEINLPRYFPFLSELPAPIANLLDFDVNGVFSGIGIFQNHAVTGDFNNQIDFSNAEAIIQRADGLVQYYLQVGGYSIPALGAPFTNLGHAVNALYGPLPAAFLKIAPTGSFSLMAGNLPTLIGAEYTFTFENMNIERGLLWNQENAINRGVQINYTYGPLSASLSWNNGFYSHGYTWLTGSLAWAINSANTLSFAGGGNLGFTKSTNFATPLLNNNGQIYDLIYEYISAPCIIEPYFQETVVPHNPDIGVFKTTTTTSGAILASYAFTDRIFLTGRAEYIGSNGSRNSNSGEANLLYGVGSEAWSLTLTPTFQYKQFFIRGEVSYVQAMSYTSGAVFGSQNQNPSQVRGLIETGFIF